MRLSRRSLILASLLVVPAGTYGYLWAVFPSDRTPEGAYLRIVKAVNQGKARDFFAYTEEAAQHACFTIGDYRKKALAVARRDFPKTDLEKLEQEYAPFADAPDGADVFSLMVEREGWLQQLRHDVSGVQSVDVRGERATVITAKGTRYAFRLRPGGIWGLTAFTATLGEEAAHAARDLEQIEKAAADYARAKSAAKE